MELLDCALKAVCAVIRWSMIRCGLSSGISQLFVFFISSRNVCCGYSLIPTHYTVVEKKKNILILVSEHRLSCSFFELYNVLLKCAFFAERIYIVMYIFITVPCKIIALDEN